MRGRSVAFFLGSSYRDIIRPSDAQKKTPCYASFPWSIRAIKRVKPCQSISNFFPLPPSPFKGKEKTHAFTHPSFSGLFVTCAHRPHTTLPPAVTMPSSETLTSTIVPLVSTPSCVYMGFCGFFFTLMMGSCTVTLSSGWVTLAFL